jgi:hypothetical protein
MDEMFESQRNEYLMMKLLAYGQKTIEYQGETIPKSGFCSYDDTRQIVNFEELQEGGSLMWLEGHTMPVRGCFNDKGIVVHEFKKLVPTLLATISGSPISKLIACWYLKKNWQHFLKFVHLGMRDVYYADRKFYQQPVREVYDCLSDYPDIRDVICAVLEFDDAYRYRFQDVLSELSYLNLHKNPIKEIKRLLNIYSSREKTEGLRGRVQKIINLACLYLRFNRKLLQEITTFLINIDIEELKMSKEDIYWTKRWNNYDFYHNYQVDDEIYPGRTQFNPNN